jgi:hypothetical protein
MAARSVFAGRYTAHVDTPVVVFAIGMRINNFWDVRRWWFVGMQMGPMLRVLMSQREKGLLHTEFFFTHRGPMLLQYWRSFEDLERFARSPDDPHLRSWRDFNRIVGAHPSVGIWHETYTIAPGAYEGIYGNMPCWGMAAATSHVAVGPGREAAKERLRTRAGAG